MTFAIIVLGIVSLVGLVGTLAFLCYIGWDESQRWDELIRHLEEGRRGVTQ